MRIWVPVATLMERSMMAVGGRNTSPWTSFQPKSSWMSSYVKEKGETTYDLLFYSN